MFALIFGWLIFGCFSPCSIFVRFADNYFSVSKKMVRKRTKKILLALFLRMTTCVFFQLVYVRKYHFSFLASGEEVDRQMERIELRRLATTATTSTGPLTTTSISPQIKHRTFLTTRRSCMQHYDLLMIISSAPGNFQRRNLIRKTWAFERAFRPRWTTVFLVGQTHRLYLVRRQICVPKCVWVFICFHWVSKVM